MVFSICPHYHPKLFYSDKTGHILFRTLTRRRCGLRENYCVVQCFEFHYTADVKVCYGIFRFSRPWRTKRATPSVLRRMTRMSQLNFQVVPILSRIPRLNLHLHKLAHDLTMWRSPSRSSGEVARTLPMREITRVCRWASGMYLFRSWKPTT